jgi:anti-sigma B factor antagonist
LDNKLFVKVAIFHDTIGIITVSGEMTVFVEEFDLFYKEVIAYTKLGIYRFILDLNSLSYIDSSGIGVVMRLATNASKQNSKICVICDHPQILKIFTVSNIDKIVRFVQNIDEGLAFYGLQPLPSNRKKKVTKKN